MHKICFLQVPLPFRNNDFLATDLQSPVCHYGNQSDFLPFQNHKSQELSERQKQNKQPPPNKQTTKPKSEVFCVDLVSCSIFRAHQQGDSFLRSHFLKGQIRCYEDIPWIYLDKTFKPNLFSSRMPFPLLNKEHFLCPPNLKKILRFEAFLFCFITP